MSAPSTKPAQRNDYPEHQMQANLARKTEGTPLSLEKRPKRTGRPVRGREREDMQCSKTTSHTC